jgi:RNA polymerase sigma factor FliA
MTQAKTPGLTAKQEQLFQQALPIARRLARLEERRTSFRIEIEELESVALAAAVDAIRRYEAERCHFAPFIAQRIRWALLAFVRRRRRRLDPRGGLPVGIALRFAELGMRAICAASAVTLSIPDARGAMGTFAPGGDLANLAMCPADNPEQSLDRKRTHDELCRALETLEEPVRSLLRRHYFEGERLDIAARDLGMSKHRAYRLHREAMITLRRHLTRAGLGPNGSSV